jgi:hypothetical protein
MSSEPACQVARSWVDVGFLHGFSGEVYDFYTVSTEYFGYTLVLRSRSSFSYTKQAKGLLWTWGGVYEQCAESEGNGLETAGGYTLVISCNLRGGALLARSNNPWTNIAHTSSSQGRSEGQSGKVLILNGGSFLNFNENSEWLTDLIHTNQWFLHIEHESKYFNWLYGKCAKNLAPTGIRSPDCSARSQSLYRLSYPAHCNFGGGGAKYRINNFIYFIHLSVPVVTRSKALVYGRSPAAILGS